MSRAIPGDKKAIVSAVFLIDPAARCHHFMGESLGECHHSWLCPVDGCDSAAAASHHPASTRSRRGLNLHLLGKIKRGRRYLCHGQVGVLSPNSTYFLGWSSKISITGWVTINHTPSYLTLAYLSSEVELTTFESLKGRGNDLFRKPCCFALADLQG